LLLKGSIVWCVDNSGCGSIKIIQLYSNLINHGGECFRGVLKDFNPNKNKLVKKKHYTVACLGTNVYVHRFCEYLINFPLNAILMLTDLKNKLMGSRI